MKTRKFICSLFVLVASIPHVLASDAETNITQRTVTDSDCKRYAKSAQGHQSSNERYRCGFRGPRWSSSYNHHYSWCSRHKNFNLLLQEANARSKEIAACHRREFQAVNQRCRAYATSAVRQQNQNAESRCGLRGARWSDNFAYHYNWCAGRPDQNLLDREAGARERELVNCPQVPRPRQPVKPAVCAEILHREQCGAGGRQVYVRNTLRNRSVEATVEVLIESEGKRRRSNRTIFLAAGATQHLQCNRSGGILAVPARLSHMVVGCRALD